MPKVYESLTYILQRTEQTKIKHIMISVFDFLRG